MEVTYSSLPKILYTKENSLFTAISALTAILGMMFIILQIYTYRNNRKLRLHS